MSNRNILAGTVAVAGAFAIAGLAFGLMWLLGVRPDSAAPTNQAGARPAPVKRKYAPLVERGEQGSDAQIAYNEDRNVTASCPHLRLIEHAMRLEGIATRLLSEPWIPDQELYSRVSANCRINLVEMQRRFTLSGSTQYSDGYSPEHYQCDNPWAALTCTECRSTIGLVHPEWPQADSKWFPAAPA